MPVIKKEKAKYRLVVYDLKSGKSSCLSLSNGYKNKEELVKKLERVL